MKDFHPGQWQKLFLPRNRATRGEARSSVTSGLFASEGASWASGPGGQVSTSRGRAALQKPLTAG